jgi:Flp pilus assembly pilin Flp
MGKATAAWSLANSAFSSDHCWLALLLSQRGSQKVAFIRAIWRKIMRKVISRLWKEEEGQDLTEYALLLVLISLVAVVSMQTVGSAVSDVFVNATTNLTT